MRRFFALFRCGVKDLTDLPSSDRINDKLNKSDDKSDKSDKSRRKKDIIPRRVREEVWLKYSGNSDKGVCYVCGIKISRYNAGWHCSHVIADIKGGQEIVENLRTCCRHCNLSMGDQNLYAYIRDKNMNGPGRGNVEKYFESNKSEINDKRTIRKK